MGEAGLGDRVRREGRPRLHGREIDDVDDDAVPARGKERCGDLRQEEGSLEVHADHPVEVRLTDIGEWHALEERRAVDENIESAEPVARRLDQAEPVLCPRDVGSDGERFAAGGLDVAYRAMCVVGGRVIIHHDPRARPGETQGERASQTMGAARDQGNAAGKVNVHGAAS